MIWREDDFFYNVIFDESGKNDIGHKMGETILPRTPKCIREGEDAVLQRICLSPSVESSLTAIGADRLDSVFDRISETMEFSEQVELKLVVRKFKKEKLKRNENHLWLSEELDKKELVPDAYITGECWYTEPLVPDEVDILWLVGWTQSECESIIPYRIRAKMSFYKKNESGELDEFWNEEVLSEEERREFIEENNSCVKIIRDLVFVQ